MHAPLLVCVYMCLCVCAGASAASQTQSPFPALLCFVSTQIFALPAWKTHKNVWKTRGKCRKNVEENTLMSLA